jgi:hypothetical protein
VKGRRDISSSLLEAQERLVELRKIVRSKERATFSLATDHGRSLSTSKDLANYPTHLPDHLGWGSETLTRALKATRSSERHQPKSKPNDLEHPQRELAEELVIHCSLQPPEPIPQHDLPANDIKLYPDIALALLREQLVAPGRLWLLLRYIDQRGRGWLEIAEARRLLTTKKSALRVVGWRQMRKLLTRGEGLFWQRNNQRIWLRSPLKVAASLNIRRFNHQPVGLPKMILLQNIGLVRAHFYASFHSGRAAAKENPGPAAPISRATLQALCQTSRRTLRNYERQAGVHSQRNFAIGKPLTVQEHQNQAWARGRAVLKISDHEGRVGRKGVTYTAWQLPNSYSGPHKKQPKGRQKRMNRKLADLFMKGMTGNGEQVDQPGNGDGQRRFFDNSVAATTTYNRQPMNDLYWRGRQQKAPRVKGQFQLWHWLPAQSDARRRQDCDHVELARSARK